MHDYSLCCAISMRIRFNKEQLKALYLQCIEQKAFKPVSDTTRPASAPQSGAAASTAAPSDIGAKSSKGAASAPKGAWGAAPVPSTSSADAAEPVAVDDFPALGKAAGISPGKPSTDARKALEEAKKKAEEEAAAKKKVEEPRKAEEPSNAIKWCGRQTILVAVCGSWHRHRVHRHVP